MPFERLIPRAFHAAGVRMHAPAAGGVYGISNAAEWIFIGESEDIQASLLNHLQQTDLALGKNPAGFVYELCAAPQRSDRLSRLLREYNPTGNRPASRYPVSRPR
jgi:hypothetical protein